MRLYDQLINKLSTANKSMADTHKIWRDENLNTRESVAAVRDRELTKREALAEAKLEQVRISENRWFRKKIGFSLVALAAAVPSFLLGVVWNSFEISNLRLSKSSSEESSVAPAPQELLNVQKPQNSNSDAGKTTPAPTSSTSEVMPFDECISRIQKISEELAIAPINIVETSDVRMVKFKADDGSVLLTCSRLDRKLIVTRSSQ
jgi:hypothetical protein